MAVYKMVLRDGDNPDTSKLHVIVYFCNAESKVDAAKLFDDKFGPKWNVAGPTKVEDESSIPKDANFIN